MYDPYQNINPEFGPNNYVTNKRSFLVKAIHSYGKMSRSFWQGLGKYNIIDRNL